jgi:hypothetical protein
VNEAVGEYLDAHTAAVTAGAGHVPHLSHSDDYVANIIGCTGG